MGRTPKILKQFYVEGMPMSEYNAQSIMLARPADDVEKLSRMISDPDIERFVYMKARWMAVMVNGYTHPDPEIEQFVWDTLINVEGGLHNVLTDAFADNLVYGHHISEIVWKADGDRLRIKRFVYIPPEDRVVLVSKKGDFAGIKLYNGTELGPEKLFYFNMHPNRGIFGKSEIASLYPYYLLLRSAAYNYARVMERFGIPWAIGKTEDTSRMIEILKDMYNIASAAIDVEEDISIIEPRYTGQIFENAIEMCLSAFIRHLGIPELMVMVKNTGTYNLGEVQYRAFMDELESLARKQNKPLVHALVRNILNLNFGEDVEVGEFVIIKDANVESMKAYAAVLQMMNQAESLNDQIRAWVYERMGIPKDRTGLEVISDDAE